MSIFASECSGIACNKNKIEQYAYLKGNTWKVVMLHPSKMKINRAIVIRAEQRCWLVVAETLQLCFISFIILSHIGIEFEMTTTWRRIRSRSDSPVSPAK